MLLILYSLLLIICYSVLISISSLYSFYFYFELQWMLISLLFIIGNAVYRGLISYLIVNSIISIWLLSSIISVNSFLFILSLYSKLGYFPFIFISLFIYNSSSFMFILLDLMFKWCYINSLISLFTISIFSLTSNYLLLLVNLFSIISLTRFLVSIKHVLFISSFTIILFIILLLITKNELFSINYLIIYTIQYWLFITLLFELHLARKHIVIRN